MAELTPPDEKAASLFLKGYNCAQGVLLAMFEYWNGQNELIPKIASAFGGGIGRCGSVCGALSGGVMAIGTKYGTNEPLVEKRLRGYELARRLYKTFETQNGSVLCMELIGYTLSNPEELEKARKEKIFDNKCTNFIKSAVRILIELTEQQT